MAYYGSRFNLEAAIPILIIVLLVIGVIALNPGWVSGIPILGTLFGGGAPKVLVIGTTAADWSSTLNDAPGAKAVFPNGVTFETLSPTDYAKVNKKEWFTDAGYQMVILSATNIPINLQVYLEQWAAGGGKMLITKIGGIRQTDGSWGNLKRLLPVNCGTMDDCTQTVKTVSNPTIFIDNYEHSLRKNLDHAKPLGSSVELANVVVEGGKIISLFDGTSMYPGIVEKGGLTGKVIYFSFDPFASASLEDNMKNQLVINIVAYLLGMEGYE